VYLPKCSSLSGSSPIQGGASSESELLNGEDGAWPWSAESVKGVKVLCWLSCNDIGGFSASDTREHGNGVSDLEKSNGI
jgi:hypothetical protein